MQIRRDGSMFFFLLIICFIIVLFYQYHYTSDRSSRTGEYHPTMRTMEKFRSSLNQYSTVGMISLENIPLIGILFYRIGFKSIAFK